MCVSNVCVSCHIRILTIGLSTLGTRYVLRVKTIFILFCPLLLSCLSALSSEFSVKIKNILTIPFLQQMKSRMIAVCQAFITYLDHYLYVIGQNNQQRIYQLQRYIYYLCYVLPVCFERKTSQIIFILFYRIHRVASFMTIGKFWTK